MSYIEKATYDYIKKVLTDGIRILLSRKFIVFSALLLLVAILNTVISLGKDSLSITDDNLTWFFIIQIAISLSFVFFGIFGKKVRRWIFRILWIIILSIVFFALLGLVNISGEVELQNLLVQGLPIFFMFLWCIIIPLASFSFIKSLFYSRFTGTILFLGKPEEDRNSLFAGPVIICTFIGILLSYFYLTSTGGLPQGLNTFVLAAGVLTGILSIYIFFVAIGKIYSNDVFSSTLSFYFITSLPILLMLGWAVLTVEDSSKTISMWNYFILAFSLIFSSQKVFRFTDVKAVEDKYPEPDSLSKKELKKLEKEKAKDDPFMMSKIIRFIGSEGLVFILLGSLLGYHLLQLQLYTGVHDDLFNQLTGGAQRVSIVYQSLVLFVIAFIILFVSLAYFLSGGVRGFFKPVHYKIGFLPPYDQLKETLDGLKTGEIDWKTFVAGSSFKLALGGIKAGASGTVKAGGAVLSGVANLFRRDKEKDED